MGGKTGLRSPKSMEEKLKTQDTAGDENREVALGICFGTGLGTVAGVLFGNVMLWLSAGGVLGVVAGVIVGSLKKAKK